MMHDLIGVAIVEMGTNLLILIDLCFQEIRDKISVAKGITAPVIGTGRELGMERIEDHQGVTDHTIECERPSFML